MTVTFAINQIIIKVYNDKNIKFFYKNYANIIQKDD